MAKHTDRNTAAPVQTTTAHVPPPETQLTPLAARNRNYVASSSSLIDGVNKPSLPSIPLLKTGFGGDTASSMFPTLLQLARVLIKQFLAANPPSILQVNWAGEETAEPTVVRPDQPQVGREADGPRNFDTATGRGQGQATDRYVAPSQLPELNLTTNLEVPGPPHQEEAPTTLPQQQEVSTTPQQQQQPQQEKTIEPEGACSSCYCDLPLIMS